MGKLSAINLLSNLTKSPLLRKTFLAARLALRHNCGTDIKLFNQEPPNRQLTPLTSHVASFALTTTFKLIMFSLPSYATPLSQASDLKCQMPIGPFSNWSTDPANSTWLNLRCLVSHIGSFICIPYFECHWHYPSQWWASIIRISLFPSITVLCGLSNVPPTLPPVTTALIQALPVTSAEGHHPWLSFHVKPAFPFCDFLKTEV